MAVKSSTIFPTSCSIKYKWTLTRWRRKHSRNASIKYTIYSTKRICFLFIFLGKSVDQWDMRLASFSRIKFWWNCWSAPTTDRPSSFPSPGRLWRCFLSSCWGSTWQNSRGGTESVIRKMPLSRRKSARADGPERRQKKQLCLGVAAVPWNPVKMAPWMQGLKVSPQSEGPLGPTRHPPNRKNHFPGNGKINHAFHKGDARFRNVATLIYNGLLIYCCVFLNHAI